MGEKISIYLPTSIILKKINQTQLEAGGGPHLSCKNEVDITVDGMRKALCSPQAHVIPFSRHQLPWEAFTILQRAVSELPHVQQVLHTSSSPTLSALLGRTP